MKLVFTSSGEKEPSSQFIAWVNNKLMSPCDECPSTYFRYNRLIWPNLCVTGYSPTERAGLPYNTLNNDLLTISYFALRIMQSHAARNTRPCGRAIHLGVGKDADVTTMMNLVFRRAGENCAIQKAQVLFKRMPDL